VFYKVYTSYPKLRLEEHNNGDSRYTANKGPWKMVYLEKMPDKRTPLIREKQLKRVCQIYQLAHQARKQYIRTVFPIPTRWFLKLNSIKNQQKNN